MASARICSAHGHVPGASALRETIDALALGDRDVARDVTSMLIDTNRAALRFMTAARESDAWDDLGRATHRLAGSLCMLQCRLEIALAGTLERAARAHDASAVDALLPCVTRAIYRLNERLGELLV